MSLSTIAETELSDQTLRLVSIKSTTAKKGRITPIRRMGTFMLASKLADKKKQPIGTPAFPIAARVAIKIQATMTPGWISRPAFCIR